MPLLSAPSAPSPQVIILGILAAVLFGILIATGVTSSRVEHCEKKKSTALVVSAAQPSSASWLQTAMSAVMPTAATSKQ